jgi:predicted MFS family arabinose efflux permease
VGAAFVGVIVSYGPLLAFTFGVFAQAIETELAVSRTAAYGLFVAYNAGILTGAAFAGRAIRRWGAGNALVVSTVLLGALLLTCLIGRATMLHLYLLFYFAPVLGFAAGPIGYSQILVDSFDRRRGLALGLALSGVGVGGALLPAVAEAAIRSGGVGLGFAVLGALVLAIGGPATVVLRRQWQKLQSRSASNRAQLVGQVNAHALARGAAFFFVLGVTIVGVSGHLVPIMVERGQSPQAAARMLAILGVSSIIGRVGVGLALDRVFAPKVGIGTAAIATCGMIMLLLEAPMPLTLILFGLALGAELDLLSYLVSRYAPPERFSSVFAISFASFSIGAAAGPLLIAAGRDAIESYSLSIILAAAATAAASLLMVGMPSYSVDLKA